MTSKLLNLEPLDFDLELSSNDSIEIISKKMLGCFSRELLLLRMKELIWEMFSAANFPLNATVESKPEYNLILGLNGTSHTEDVKLKVLRLLENTGCKTILQALVVKTFEKLRASKTVEVKSVSKNNGSPSTVKRAVRARVAALETNEPIRECRLAWERGINEELLSIGSELQRKFVFSRPDHMVNPYLEQSLTQSARENVRFLYDSEDLYETCINIKNNGSKSVAAYFLPVNYHAAFLGSIQLHLRPCSLDELTTRYSDLSPSHMQLGLDDYFNTNGVKHLMKRHDEGLQLLKGQDVNGIIQIDPNYVPSITAVRRFLRRGCPTSLRCYMWRVALGLPPLVTKREEAKFASLRRQCDKFDMLTDELFVHDVGNVSDDLRFFVFEDALKTCMLCFSRDESVRTAAEYEIHKPLLHHTCAEQTDRSAASPPSGVQPFLGLSAYFAPLCYIYSNEVSLYSVINAFYCRIWCRLNVICSDRGALLHVCSTFEQILCTSHPKLYLHLMKVGAKPLHIALPWLQLGFVGLLEVDQILILWDRVLGYMDVSIFAVFAAAVFVFKAPALLLCSTPVEVGHIMNDGFHLRVVPLLQMFLFSEARNANT